MQFSSPPLGASIVPVAPLAIRRFTATTALGRGRDAQLNALRDRRGGLRPNDFGGGEFGGEHRLDCWIGRVDGLESAALPEALAHWECRNNRLAWLALQQDGMPVKVIWDYTYYWALLAPLFFGQRLTSVALLGRLRDAFAQGRALNLALQPLMREWYERNAAPLRPDRRFLNQWAIGWFHAGR